LITVPPHRARKALLAALTALSAGCSSVSGKKASYEPPLVPLHHVYGTICGVRPRVDPGCGVLWDPLDPGSRDDCPEAKIAYDVGENESPTAAPVLATLAAEMTRIPHLTDVEIVVASGEGEDVRVLDRRFHRTVAALGALGVAPERLSRAYQPAGWKIGYVSFVAFACDRKEIVQRRRPGQDR
jgi:hypothetical protein